MDDNPTRMIETDQSSCPIDAPEKSCRADSGAYIVHPARAAPSGTNRLDSITSPAAKNDQNDHARRCLAPARRGQKRPARSGSSRIGHAAKRKRHIVHVMSKRYVA